MAFAPTPRRFLRRTAPAALLLLLAGATGRLSAQQVQFRQLTPDDGLSGSWVKAILRDSRGFMWFGTATGLNRYDGYRFTVYRPHRDRPGSIAEGFINSLHEDRDGVLWIATSAGLSRYDRARDAFDNYVVQTADAPGEPRNVAHVLEDGRGQLWLGAAGGLFRFDRATGRSTPHPLNESVGLSDDAVQALYEGTGRTLWIGTQFNGLIALDPETGALRRYRHDPRDPRSLPADEVRAVYEDAAGTVWIGTYGGGLAALDRRTGRITAHRHDPANPRSISVDRVVTLAGDGRGGVWVGTENGGLDHFDPSSGAFTNHRPDAGDPASLSGNSIWALYQDPSGMLWVGTFAGGLNVTRPYGQAIRHYRSVAGDPHSLGYNVVKAFLEDAQGIVWIATDGGGLNRFDRATGRFTRYDSRTSNLNSDAVLDVVEDHAGNLWIGTWAGGISRFDRRTGAFTPFTSRNSNLPNDNIFALHVDRSGRLWLGGQQADLLRFDAERGSFVRYVTAAPGTQQSTIRVIRGTLDGEHLLIGTESSGLVVFEIATGRATRFQSVPEDPTTLSDNAVRSVVESEPGVVWVATLNGLDRLDRRSGRVRRFSEDDGLPSNLIAGLAVDAAGHLWISTDRGVARFDPRSESFAYFVTAHGLQGSEFGVRADYRARDGSLFFGGSNGFNVIRPELIGRNEQPPAVALTGFQLFNRPVPIGAPGSPLSRHIGETDHLRLSYQQSVLAFEFAALDFTAPEKNRYAYLLEGFDAEWNEVGTARTATYTNLPAGRYLLRVRASNNDGVWNSEGATLRITVTPPFWETWWFRLLVLLAIGAAVREIVRRAQQRRDALRRQKEYLERSVANILQGMERLSEGDLTVRLRAERNDEIARLCDGFNAVVGDIRRMVEQVEEALQSTIASTQEIDASADAMAHGARDQLQQALEVAGSAEEMSASAEETAKHMGIAAEIAQSSGDRAQQGGRVVRETVASMDNILAVVKRSAAIMEALGASSQRIGKVTSVIGEVADQSNLLALNAAIEAARAGEHGRSFAIVADEVRKLAESTAHSTKEIAGMVQQIQADTRLAIETMAQVNVEVESGNVLVAQTGAALDAIIANSDEVLERIQQVAAAGEEHAATSSEITDRIESISEVTRNAASGTEAIAAAARRLADQVELLRARVARFRLGDAPPQDDAADDAVETAPRLVAV